MAIVKELERRFGGEIMPEIEEKIHPIETCPACKTTRYYLYESPLDARDSITWKGIGHYTLHGKLLEIRICANCGCLYMGTRR